MWSWDVFKFYRLINWSHNTFIMRWFLIQISLEFGCKYLALYPLYRSSISPCLTTITPGGIKCPVKAIVRFIFTFPRKKNAQRKALTSKMWWPTRDKQIGVECAQWKMSILYWMNYMQAMLTTKAAEAADWNDHGRLSVDVRLRDL